MPILKFFIAVTVGFCVLLMPIVSVVVAWGLISITGGLASGFVVAHVLKEEGAGWVVGFFVGFLLIVAGSDEILEVWHSDGAFNPF